MLDHGSGRGRADNLIAIMRNNANGTLGGGKLGQVRFLVRDRAVIEIGPIAEYNNAQLGERGQHGLDLADRERHHLDRHFGGVSCAVYSLMVLVLTHSNLLSSSKMITRGLCVLASSSVIAA